MDGGDVETNTSDDRSGRSNNGATHSGQRFNSDFNDKSYEDNSMNPAIPLKSPHQFVSEEDYYKHYGRRSNAVQKCTIGLVILVVAILIIILGLASSIEDKVSNLSTSSSSSTTTVSLGLSGYPDLTWDDVVTLGTGQTVNFYSWNGSTVINDWITQTLAPGVKDQYQINLNFVQPGYAETVVDLVAAERAAGNDKNGVVDMVWINGENFYKMKLAGNLYGPFANKLPNSDTYDFTSTSIAYDFGEPTQGYEVSLLKFVYFLLCSPVDALHGCTDRVHLQFEVRECFGHTEHGGLGNVDHEQPRQVYVCPAVGSR
jgi:hypothetical protein